MTPEETGRQLLGPALLARLQRHLAPPLLEDLCQRVAAVERERDERWQRAVGMPLDVAEEEQARLEGRS